ncbi:hypothetical protein C3L33_01028, partial [Rhododendron williamsianum]
MKIDHTKEKNGKGTFCQAGGIVLNGSKIESRSLESSDDEKYSIFENYLPKEMGRALASNGTKFVDEVLNDVAVLSVEWAKRVVRWHRLFRSDDSTSCDPRSGESLIKAMICIPLYVVSYWFKSLFVIFSNFHCDGRVDGEVCLKVMVARVGLDFLRFKVLSVIALPPFDYSQS